MPTPRVTSENPVSRRGRQNEEEETTTAPRRSSSTTTNEDRNGWGDVAKKKKVVEERKEKSKNNIHDFYIAEDGASAIVQLLDDAPTSYDAHNVKDGKFFRTYTCQLMAQKHCLMCREGSKITWKYAFKVLDYRGDYDKKTGEFLYNKKEEKLWVVGQKLAQQLHDFKNKRSGRELTEMVLLVTRSGKGTSTTYNLELALDKDEVKMKPVRHVSTYPDTSELVAPMSDDELEATNFTVPDND